MREKHEQVLEDFALLVLLVAVQFGAVLEPVRECKQFLNHVPVPFLVVLLMLFQDRIQIHQVHPLVFVLSESQSVKRL